MNSDIALPRINQWQAALRDWPNQKAAFAKYKTPCDPYTVAWLDDYLKSVYDHILDPIRERLRGTPPGTKDWSFIAYVICVAEKIEPPFRSRLRAIVECQVFTEIEDERAQSDYLGYLLCGNGNEDIKTFTVVLNREVTYIEGILNKRYNTKAQKKGLAKIVNEMITKAKECADLEAKQYIILIALIREPLYRQRFLPTKVTKETPIRANPKRFLFFITEILKPLFEQLKTGNNISGLMEFVKEARPAYMMIN